MFRSHTIHFFFNLKREQSPGILKKAEYDHDSMTGEKWVKQNRPSNFGSEKREKEITHIISQQKEHQGREKPHNHKHCPNMLEQKQLKKQNKTKKQNRKESN